MFLFPQSHRIAHHVYMCSLFHKLYCESTGLGSAQVVRRPARRLVPDPSVRRRPCARARVASRGRGGGGRARTTEPRAKGRCVGGIDTSVRIHNVRIDSRAAARYTVCGRRSAVGVRGWLRRCS